MSHHPTLLRRTVALLLAAAAVAAGGLVTAQTAAAGEYRVFACRLGDGRPTSLGDWKLDYNGPYGSIGPGTDYCATQGYAYFEVGPPQTGTFDWTAVGVNLPDGLLATSLRGNRWARTDPGETADHLAAPGYELRWGRGPRWSSAASGVLDHCREANGCRDVDNAWGREAPAGNIAVDFPGGAKFVAFGIGCLGQEGGACRVQPTGRGHLRVNKLDLTVQDDTSPTASAASGTILQGGARSGTQTLTFAANDVGAGIFQAVLAVDGQEVARIRPDRSAGCADAGSLPEMELEFTALQPCLRSTGVAFDIDTTRFANGAHRLTALVRDASGNLSNVISNDVTFANAAPTPDPLPAPSEPNGTGGSLASAKLGQKGERTKLSTAYGSKPTLSGKLLDAAGQPIVGAAVVVDERLDTTGAVWTNATVLTTDVKGLYRYAPNTRASRTIRFSWAKIRGGTPTSERTVDIGVRAKLSIAAASRSVARRGLIKLSGKATLDGIPKRGMYVEIQAVVNGRWRTIESRRASSRGRWSFSYRLKTATRGTLSFRVRLRPAGDVPAADSRSAAVRIRVR